MNDGRPEGPAATVIGADTSRTIRRVSAYRIIPSIDALLQRVRIAALQREYGHEATVGALILSGGRRTQLGYVGVIGFYLALWLFGWFETVWVLTMLAPMVLLLRAERRAATGPAPAAHIEETPLARVGS